MDEPFSPRIYTLNKLVVRECPMCWALIAHDRYIDHVYDCRNFTSRPGGV